MTKGKQNCPIPIYSINRNLPLKIPPPPLYSPLSHPNPRKKNRKKIPTMQWGLYSGVAGHWHPPPWCYYSPLARCHWPPSAAAAAGAWLRWWWACRSLASARRRTRTAWTAYSAAWWNAASGWGLRSVTGTCWSSAWVALCRPRWVLCRCSRSARPPRAEGERPRWGWRWTRRARCSWLSDRPPRTRSWPGPSRRRRWRWRREGCCPRSPCG